jgi:cell division protein FtsZ
MSGAGSALMGIGSSRGDDRAVAAAEMAISSPLLEASIDGAHGVLLSIQGGSDLGLFEINEAAQLVANSAAVDANIIFGAVIDDALGDEVRVTVIAAGFDEQQRPGRSATVTAVPAAGGRSPAALPAGANGAVNGSGTPGGSRNGGAASGPAAGAAATGASATTSWAGNGSTVAGHGTGDNSSAAERPASATAANAASAPGAATPDAGTPSASGTWSVPSSSYSSSSYSPSSYSSGDAGYTTSTAADIPAADPIAEVPAQPASDGPSSYVPSPVSFVSDDDEDYGSRPGYDGYDGEHGGDAAPGSPGQAGAGPGWKDSGRAGKQDKVFDVTAGRRRPVVFEEEDDLDVPDFLK